MNQETINQTLIVIAYFSILGCAGVGILSISKKYLIFFYGLAFIPTVIYQLIIKNYVYGFSILLLAIILPVLSQVLFILINNSMVNKLEKNTKENCKELKIRFSFKKSYSILFSDSRD